jgi:predicted RNase H-like HicB family nuclease
MQAGCNEISLKKISNRRFQMKYYTAVLKKSGKQFVALCLELGVVGSGSTRSQATQSLRAAIDSYIDYAAEVGLPETRPVAIQQLNEFLLGFA